MSDFSDNFKKILKSVEKAVKGVTAESTEQVLNKVAESSSIFVFGAGRSGLVGKAFAMRLVHLGKTVHFVGESTMPAITHKDVLIVISGSGKTSSVHLLAEAASEQGATVICITSEKDSPIGQLANMIIEIPIARESSKEDDYLARQLVAKELSPTPLGTLFELSAMLYLDSLVPALMEKLRISETFMQKKHSNLE